LAVPALVPEAPDPTPDPAEPTLPALADDATLLSRAAEAAAAAEAEARNDGAGEAVLPGLLSGEYGEAEWALMGGRPRRDGGCGFDAGGALPECAMCFFLNTLVGEAARLANEPFSSAVVRRKQKQSCGKRGNSLFRLPLLLSASLSMSLARYGDGLARSLAPRRAFAAAMRDAPRRVLPEYPRHEARCGA
jgi:hypothetical protein